MSFFGSIGIAVFIVFFSLYLKPQQKELSILLSIAGAAVLFLTAVQKSGEAVRFIRDAMETTAFSAEVTVMLKALGIAASVQIAADICRQAGEATVAGQIEMIGKMEILLLSLPLAARLLTHIQGLLS